MNQSDSDDPNESRAGTIKKKAKLDPFSARTKTLTTNLLGTVDASTKRLNGGSIKQSHGMPHSINAPKLGKWSHIWPFAPSLNVADVTLEKDHESMAATSVPPIQKIRPTISREILGNAIAQEVADSDPNRTLRPAFL